MSSVCLRCSKSERGGCCKADPDGEDRAFGITVADVSRIAKATGKKPSEFLSVSRPPDDLRRSLTVVAPDLSKAFTNGVRLHLKLTSEGYCSLLTPTGCPMTSEDRPRVCALFPSYYQAIGKSLTLIDDALTTSDKCLALEECNGSPTVLYNLLGTSRRQLESIATEARKEALAHSQLSKKEIKQKLLDLE